ncbi:hypothetical protein GCM10009101_28000 [Brevundimonas lenta]
MYMPVPAIPQAIRAPNGPVAAPKRLGRLNIPAPTIEPTTIAVSIGNDIFWADCMSGATSLVLTAGLALNRAGGGARVIRGTPEVRPHDPRGRRRRSDAPPRPAPSFSTATGLRVSPDGPPNSIGHMTFGQEDVRCPMKAYFVPVPPSPGAPSGDPDPALPDQKAQSSIRPSSLNPSR